MESKFIQTTVRTLVRMLVDHKYQQIYDNDADKAITPSQIERALEGYGELTMPPNEAFEKIDIYETDDPNEVRIDFDLWFDNHRGDITLSCAIYNSRPLKYGIENIHML